MTLDPMPDAATLLRLKAEREGRTTKPVEPSRPLLAAFQSIAAMPSPARAEPVALRIPWSCLVSDNAMYVVDKKTGKRHTTAEYREARKRIRALAKDAVFGPLADRPLAVVGRFYVPNNHRRDTHNFGAALADSLKGVVFTDDHWLHDVRWIRAGVDVDAPRCELTISPLSP